jgi:hypothetical protein
VIKLIITYSKQNVPTCQDFIVPFFGERTEANWQRVPAGDAIPEEI